MPAEWVGEIAVLFCQVRRKGGLQAGTLATEALRRRDEDGGTTVDFYALHGGRGGLLTVSGAAEQLRVGTQAVYRFRETGDLPHIRFANDGETSFTAPPDDEAALLAALAEDAGTISADDLLSQAGHLRERAIEVVRLLRAVRARPDSRKRSPW